MDIPDSQLGISFPPRFEQVEDNENLGIFDGRFEHLRTTAQHCWCDQAEKQGLLIELTDEPTEFESIAQVADTADVGHVSAVEGPQLKQHRVSNDQQTREIRWVQTRPRSA